MIKLFLWNREASCVIRNGWVDVPICVCVARRVAFGLGGGEGPFALSPQQAASNSRCQMSRRSVAWLGYLLRVGGNHYR